MDSPSALGFQDLPKRNHTHTASKHEVKALSLGSVFPAVSVCPHLTSVGPSASPASLLPSTLALGNIFLVISQQCGAERWGSRVDTGMWGDSQPRGRSG